MKYLWVLALIFCAGCGPGYADPYLQRAAGQAAIEATQAAQYERSQMATMTAKQLRQAIDATQAAQAFEAQRTQFALEVDAAHAERTRAAAQATSTQSAVSTESSYRATTTAAAFAAQATASAASDYATATVTKLEIITAEKINQDQQTAAAIMAYLPVCVSFAALISILAILAVRLIAWDRRQSVIEGNPGTRAIVLIRGPDGATLPYVTGPDSADILIRPVVRQLPRSSDDEGPEFSPGNVTVTYPRLPTALPSGTAALRIRAVTLIREAIAIYSTDGNVIPGWRDLDGWNSGRWQSVVHALKGAGEVITSSTGTQVNTNLGDVLYRLENGQIKLSPPPPENG